MTRERMISAIRASLQTTRSELEAMAASATEPPPFVHPQQQDLAAQFAEEVQKLHAHAHRCADDAQALGVIEQLLQAQQAKSVLAWNIEHVGLPGLPELLEQLGVAQLNPAIAQDRPERAAQLKRIDQVDACISGADMGIAESGTLVLRGGTGRGRLASLIAPLHIAILREAQLVRGLGQAFADIHERYGSETFGQTSSIVLISGPSRTADIEQTLTLGAHGPRDLHILLINASRS